MLELYPRSKIRINIEIVSAEAGTRCVGLTAASVALADAGIPMTEMVVSVASGKINDIVVGDLNKEEDNYGEADCLWESSKYGRVGFPPNGRRSFTRRIQGSLAIQYGCLEGNPQINGRGIEGGSS